MGLNATKNNLLDWYFDTFDMHIRNTQDICIHTYSSLTNKVLVLGPQLRLLMVKRHTLVNKS